VEKGSMKKSLGYPRNKRNRITWKTDSLEMVFIHNRILLSHEEE
jgi:hypothetical protein